MDGTHKSVSWLNEDMVLGTFPVNWLPDRSLQQNESKLLVQSTLSFKIPNRDKRQEIQTHKLLIERGKFNGIGPPMWLLPRSLL